MARIVLVTIGSLGDLHPFIAIGRALVSRGEEVLLAVPEDDVAKVRAAGLDAVSILPGYASICARLGMSAQEVAARVVADTNFVIDEIVMPSLAASTAALDRAVAGADVLAGSIFAFAAPIVAEKRGLPLAAVVLQPMTLFSAWEPPIAPRFEAMRHGPRTALGRAWNRAFYAMVGTMLRRRHGARIDAVRAEHGLAPDRGAPLLDHGSATRALVCAWSPALGTLPPDAPANATQTGFAFFDNPDGADAAIAPELAAFLDEGPAPLVFTLGSFAIHAAGRFYAEAAEASRLLGRRAVLLTGQPGPPCRDGDCLSLPYAPFSEVFPRAAAVIHHGGVGTTGQALRAGRPQVIVPHFGDQFDNAARVSAGGSGVVLRRERFTARTAGQAIAHVLEDDAMLRAARQAQATIAREDGAQAAAARIAALAGDRAITG